MFSQRLIPFPLIVWRVALLLLEEMEGIDLKKCYDK